MRLLIASPSYLPAPHCGGLEICLHEEASRLAARHEVAVFTSRTSRGWESHVPFRLRHYLPGTTAVYRLGFPAGQAYLLRQLRRLAKEFRADLIHVHLAYPFAAAAAAIARERAIPSVLTCHGGDIQTDPATGYGVRLDGRVDRIVRNTIRGHQAYIAISEDVRQELLALGVNAEAIHLLPHGVDTDRLSPARDKKALRARLGLPPEALVLLSTSRHHPKKRLEDILTALVRLPADLRAKTIAVFIGKDTEALRSEAEALGVSERCRFLGEQRPDVRADQVLMPNQTIVDHYQAADLFLLPSTVETFGIVLLEAMAAGLAVVATDVPGCRHVVQDGSNGLLIPPRNPERLAVVIRQVAENLDLRQRISQAGRQTALAHSWQAAIEKHEALFMGLLDPDHDRVDPPRS